MHLIRQHVFTVDASTPHVVVQVGQLGLCSGPIPLSKFMSLCKLHSLHHLDTVSQNQAWYSVDQHPISVPGTL